MAAVDALAGMRQRRAGDASGFLMQDQIAGTDSSSTLGPPASIATQALAPRSPAQPVERRGT